LGKILDLSNHDGKLASFLLPVKIEAEGTDTLQKEWRGSVWKVGRKNV